MSSYTGGFTRATLHYSQFRGLIKSACDAIQAGVPVELVQSIEIDELTRNIGMAVAQSDRDGSSSLRARLDSLTAQPIVAAMIDIVEPGTTSKVNAILQQAGTTTTAHASVSDTKLMCEVADQVRQALRSTADRLRIDERVISVSATITAMERLGYTTNCHEGDRSTGIFATRDDTAVAVLAQDGGVVEFDWAGCTGGACIAPMDELIETIADEGVVVDIQVTRHHGDGRGGELIARASRANLKDRAAGLVMQFEQGPLADTSYAAPTPTARQRNTLRDRAR